MSYISGQTSITGSVTANVSSSWATPSATQTHINIYAGSTGSMQNVYTTTSGKTFYLMAIIIQGVGSSKTGDAFYNDGTTRICSLSSFYDSVTIHGNGVPLAVFTSGQIVKMNFATSMNVEFIGFEVTN